MIDLFTLEAVSKNAAIFDIEKLKWLNGNYIRTALPERIVDLCEPLLFDAYGKQDLAYISKIVRLFLDRLKVINEITDLTPYYFNDDFPFDEKAKKYLGSEDSSKIINTLKDKLVGVAPFIKDNIEKMFKQLAEEMKVKLGVIIHPCRAAVSGRVETPPMYDVLEVLGKDRVNKRLSKYPQ